MRLLSLLSRGFSLNKPYLFISYLAFIPEMITGPHREFEEWNIPKFKYKMVMFIQK